MRRLGLALYAEGNSDYRFLSPLLRRISHELCQTSPYEVYVEDYVLEFSVKEFGYRSELQHILRSAIAYSEGYDLVFVHADGGGDWQSAKVHHIEPAAQAIVAALPSIEPAQIVGVIPVREMEAWVLSDGDTLRSILNIKMSNAELHLPPKSAAVERISDPKKLLARILVAAGKQQGSKRMTIERLLVEVGEHINLDRLRQVPSFQRFERDLLHALTTFGYTD